MTPTMWKLPHSISELEFESLPPAVRRKVSSAFHFALGEAFPLPAIWSCSAERLIPSIHPVCASAQQITMQSVGCGKRITRGFTETPKHVWRAFRQHGDNSGVEAPRAFRLEPPRKTPVPDFDWHFKCPNRAPLAFASETLLRA
jgi:hypothetical protein